tara:strand:- start:34 stop:828 length:795 start_codon:yes stop_codon:yes gene_type:complete
MLLTKPAAITCALITTLALSGCASLNGDSDAAPASADALLPGYYWTLEEAEDQHGNRNQDLFGGDAEPLQLRFDNNMINVSGACNRLSGSYSIKGDDLVAGNLMQTMMACEEPLMLREGSIKTYLETPLEMALEAHPHSPRLTLSSDEAGKLVLQGKATPQTRYGSEGKTLFMEVQAQTVACPHPLIPDHQCMRVRELTYDAQGLKTSDSEWTLLYQGIEGFDHQPGTRNILRLQRFVVANPRADEPGIAYVLDTVIESVRVME